MVKRILAIVPDLLIETRIEGAAKGLEGTVQTVPAHEATERIASTRPELVIIDLAAAGLDIEAIAAAARQTGAQLAAFYPHVDVALRRSAKRARIDHIYARSRFLRELPAILRERLGE